MVLEGKSTRELGVRSPAGTLQAKTIDLQPQVSTIDGPDPGFRALVSLKMGPVKTREQVATRRVSGAADACCATPPVKAKRHLSTGSDDACGWTCSVSISISLVA